ncbi:MAG: hypothetical protein QOC81_4416 [Thermoanaerobaculia bacterium]|jgi:hypothetical protein|nr:hypothetical protein [Thermoanaerobaculia bacterium]
MRGVLDRSIDCRARCISAIPKSALRQFNRADHLLHYAHPHMPSMNELLGLLIAIFVIWFVLKLAKVAIRLIFFVIGVLIIAGALYYVFMR